MSNVGEHVSAFSPKENLFALINKQGILRIWDTGLNELKQEYTPNLQLVGPCSALTWILVGARTAKDKKSRKSLEKNNEQLYLALGTCTGNVHLYSYADGKIERTLKGAGHTGRINAMVIDNEGNLYSCGDDCQVIVWSLANEIRITGWSVGPEKPSCLAYLADLECLIVVSRQVKVYAKSSQELLQTFTGHTSEVTTIATVKCDDNVYALTASKLERVIYLWKIGKKGRNKQAACTLLMEDIAQFLSCKLAEDNIIVSTVTRSGVIHVYNIASEVIKTKKPVKPKLTIELASDSATVIEPIPAVASSLQIISATHELLIAYGDMRSLVFEKVKLDYTDKMQVLVRADPKKKYLTKSKQKTTKTDAAALKTVVPIVDSQMIDYKSGGNVAKKTLSKPDLPMESRLQNLSLNGTDAAATKQPESKTKLLIQALHSQNEVLLRSVLSTKDSKVIKLTLQRLPVQYVHTLVDKLTTMMQQKRQNVEFAMLWLKTLTQTHASQLMALGSEELLAKFGPCIGIIEHRMNCLQDVMKVSGRLEMLIAQIQRNIDDDDELTNENVLIYQDNDSSDSEIENKDNKSSTDDEWHEGLPEDDANDDEEDVDSMDADDSGNENDSADTENAKDDESMDTDD